MTAHLNDALWETLTPLPFIGQRDRPRCAEVLWRSVFQEAGDYGSGKTVALAKQVCAQCPLRDACRDYAITTRQRWGVWGGKLMGYEQRERKR
jgi:WhiB family redox-sensing transcriptional regulator